MRKDPDHARALSERAFTATFAMLVVALVCSVVVLVAPRPVRPTRLPALRLSPELIEAQRVHDQALVAQARAFERDPEVLQLANLYEEEGLVEFEPLLDSNLLFRQRGERSALAQRVFARLGEQGTRAFIALTVDDAMRSLAGDRTTDRARGLLGRFPELLASYGYTDAAGRPLAPELSIRAFYKARVNMVFDRPPIHDFSPIEVQAYEGFNALQSGALPPARRAEAAAAFYRAGGIDAAEALAVWLFQGGQRADSLTLFAQEYAHNHALRVRNMMLVAQRADDL